MSGFVKVSVGFLRDVCELVSEGCEDLMGVSGLGGWGEKGGAQGNRLSCRDQEGRRGSEEEVPGPSVFPSGSPACRRTFGGRRKAVKDRFALQGGIGDFP